MTTAIVLETRKGNFALALALGIVLLTLAFPHEPALPPPASPPEWSMKSIYQLSDVRHFYGERCILDVPTLDIYTGEIIAIVGPSGAARAPFSAS